MSLPPNALVSTLSRHVSLSNSRLETLATLIVGCISARTVNLSHLAGHFCSDAQPASSYRRVQRFFQYVRLDEDWLAQLIIRMLNLRAPFTLCLDRTDWKIGRKHINLLVLCIAARRVRIPVMWRVLDRAGPSSSRERINLMQRYVACCGCDTINILLADREFIGAQWFEFLVENDIPFAIRVRHNLMVELDNGRCVPLKFLFARTISKVYRGRFADMDDNLADCISFTAKRLKDRSMLIIATNITARTALNLYRKRWQIECLFGDTKKRGLNMEDTHLTNPGKLALLLAIVTLALAWAHASASTAKGHTGIKRAGHGYLRKSWFRTGLDILRRWISHFPDQAHLVWMTMWNRRPTTLKSVRVV